MHGFLNLLDVVRRNHRHAVLDEVQLAGRFGHDQFAVGRVAVKHHALAGKQPRGGGAVHVHRDQRHYQSRDHDTRRSRHPVLPFMPGEPSGNQQTGKRRQAQEREVVEPPHQNIRKQRSAENAADAVRNVHGADGAPALGRRERAAGQRQHITGHNAERRQPQKTRRHGFGKSNGCASDKHHVAQFAQREHLRQRQEGNQQEQKRQHALRVARATGRTSEPAAEPRQ